MFLESQEGFLPAWKEYAGFKIDYEVVALSPFDEETLENQEFANFTLLGFETR